MDNKYNPDFPIKSTDDIGIRLSKTHFIYQDCLSAAFKKLRNYAGEAAIKDIEEIMDMAVWANKVEEQ